MTVVRSPRFHCEKCDSEFIATKHYVLRHTKDGETTSKQVTTCPDCGERVEKAEEYEIQRAVLNPLLPKTSVKTIIKDRPVWT